MSTPTGAITNGDSSAPYAVWEHMSTGRYLWTFHDEYLAQRFAVSVSSQVIPNPANF